MSPTWIRARVRHYAAMVGLGFVPKVCFTEREWQRAVPKADWKDIHGDLQAVSHKPHGPIYIKLEKACCRRNADDTAAHEVLHLLKPKLRHGKKFNELVSEMLLGRVPE